MARDRLQLAENLMKLFRGSRLPLAAIVAGGMLALLSVGIERIGDTDEVAGMMETMLYGVVVARTEADAVAEIDDAEDA